MDHRLLRAAAQKAKFDRLNVNDQPIDGQTKRGVDSRSTRLKSGGMKVKGPRSNCLSIFHWSKAKKSKNMRWLAKELFLTIVRSKFSLNHYFYYYYDISETERLRRANARSKSPIPRPCSLSSSVPDSFKRVKQSSCSPVSTRNQHQR